MRDSHATHPSVIPNGGIAAKNAGEVVRGGTGTLYDWADRAGTP